ncbi:MAG: IS1 family transposase [Pirellulales bacterium]|nr:IS1 family transposase [Pirellulales bacterium]
MVKKNSSKSIKQTLLPPPKDDVLEVDEMWAYVGNKQNKRWLWLAISRQTRHIVAYHIGNRDDIDCLLFYKKIPKEYKKLKSYSDKWESYKNVFPYDNLRHECVNKDSGQTNHIERFNLTLRQRVGRYVRKTLSFSKSEYWHDLVTKLFIIEYNKSLVYS